MKKQMNKKLNRHPITLLLAVLLGSSVLLSACGNSASTEDTTTQEAVAEAVTQEEVTGEEKMDNLTSEAENAATEELEENSTTEEEDSGESTENKVTAETVAELLYDGKINMASTLPGEEWLTINRNKIEEPKAVVYNDITNKKVILEDGDEVTFEEGDVFVIWLPDDIDNTFRIKNYVWENEEEGVIKKLSESFEDGDINDFPYWSEIRVKKDYLKYKTSLTIDIGRGPAKELYQTLQYFFLPIEE